MCRNLAEGCTIHLVDIENQLGGARCTAQAIADWMESYIAQVGVGSADLVVVGVTSVHNAFAVKASGIGGRLVFQRGPDGADLALLRVMREERLEERFVHVNCASGDGIFASEVARLGGLGLGVTVISRSTSLSRKLRMAAKAVVFTIDQNTEKDAA